MKMYEIALNSMKQLAEMLETNEEKINQLVERMRNDNSDVCRVPGSSPPVVVKFIADRFCIDL